MKAKAPETGLMVLYEKVGERDEERRRLRVANRGGLSAQNLKGEAGRKPGKLPQYVLPRANQWRLTATAVIPGRGERRIPTVPPINRPRVPSL